MVGTGVKANENEIEELKRLLLVARRTPVIALTSEQALSGRDLSSQAWERVKTRCHEVALAHGLPEIPGYYGCDLETGEFLRDG